MAMDCVAQADEIRRLYAIPDVVVGSVAGITETGSLVAASASGSQLPADPAAPLAGSGSPGQKSGTRPPAALRCVEDHCLLLESARAHAAYGQRSAINHLLILKPSPTPGAAPSCCSARPSDSDTTRELTCQPPNRRGAPY
jgi:hypothetical protein